MKKQIDYKQYDSRWANIPYTVTGDPKQTILYSGCGPTCSAMVLATFIDPHITPPDICKLAVQNGFRTPNEGTYGGFFLG